MKLIIAEDDAVSRRLLEKSLRGWGHDPIVTTDGTAAWEALETAVEPCVALLDWMMPGMDGLEICRKVRATPGMDLTYLILVTAQEGTEHLIAGLEAGANDYVTKPFNQAELRARLRVGLRVLELQTSLADRVAELEAAIAELKQLRGILPICCYCKNIRSDEKYWQRVEDYLIDHADVDFSHGICPDCWEKVVNPQMEEMWGCRLPYEET